MLSIAAAASATAGPTGWAHQAAGFQSNGAVTVKSLAGGSYAGTQNPTGAVAKSNQNAATQAPTVIIQATSATGLMLLGTTAQHDGNLGGIAGGTAMCVAEFGAGWRMATVGRVTVAAGLAPYSAFWVIPSSSSGADCGGWTKNTSGYAGVIQSGNAGNGYYVPGFSTYTCNLPASVLCSNM